MRFTFDANGGALNGQPSVQYDIVYGQSYASAVGSDSIPVPEREGYEFLGWFYEPLPGYRLTTMQETYGLTTDGTFTAHWKKNPVPAKIKWSKGSSAKIPEVKDPGHFYIVTDKSKLYYDVDDETRIQIGGEDAEEIPEEYIRSLFDGMDIPESESDPYLRESDLQGLSDGYIRALFGDRYIGKFLSQFDIPQVVGDEEEF